MLFRQGHQTGPWLLHSLTAGLKTTDQVQSDWSEAEKTAASRASKKLTDMTFECRTCHQRKRAEHFPSHAIGSSDPLQHATAVLEQGAWRRCARCALTQPSRQGMPSSDPKPFRQSGKEVLVCNKCREEKHQRHFRLRELNELNQRGALDLAACIACTPERQRSNVQAGTRILQCRLCQQHKPASLFDDIVFNRHRGLRDAACTECMDRK